MQERGNNDVFQCFDTAAYHALLTLTTVTYATFVPYPHIYCDWYKRFFLQVLSIVPQ